MSEDNVIVKKITPYPFAINVVKEGKTDVIKGNVVKLTEVGYLVEFADYIPLVGDNFEAEFHLPAVLIKFMSRVKVVKTYDSFRTAPKTVDEAMKTAANSQPPAAGGGAEDKSQPHKLSGTIHLAEMHFIGQTPDQKKKIKEWLLRIKQV